MVPPATLVAGIGTKVNISTMGRPRIKIKVSKRVSQQTASDEIIKVAPPATLVVRIGTKVQTEPNQTTPNNFLDPIFFRPKNKICPNFFGPLRLLRILRILGFLKLLTLLECLGLLGLLEPLGLLRLSGLLRFLNFCKIGT